MFSYSLFYSPFEKDSLLACHTCVCFTSASFLYYYFVKYLPVCCTNEEAVNSLVEYLTKLGILTSTANGQFFNQESCE